MPKNVEAAEDQQDSVAAASQDEAAMSDDDLEAKLWAEADTADTQAAGDAGDDDDDAGPSEKDRQDAVYAANADAETGDEDTPGEADKTKDAGASTAAADDKAAKATSDDDKGAKPGGAGKQPSGGGSTDKDLTQAEAWAGATPEEHRAAFEAAQKQLQTQVHENRSNRGRLSVMQREIDRLKTGSTATQPNVSRETRDAGKADAAKGASGYLASAEWKAVKEEYGDVLTPVETLINAMQQELTELRSGVTAINDERQASDHQEQKRTLEGIHPDYMDVFAGNVDHLDDWINSEPRHVREAFVRNQEHVVDAAEAADVVARFKAFLGIETPSQQQQQQNTSGKGDGQAEAGKDNGNPQAKAGLSDKRKRQLGSATDVRGKSPGAASGIPEDGDEEEIWKMYDQQEAQEQRRRAS